MLDLDYKATQPILAGVGMVQQKILEKLFDTISHEPITFNKLCRAAKIHPMTVRTYLKINE